MKNIIKKAVLFSVLSTTICFNQAFSYGKCDYQMLNYALAKNVGATERLEVASEINADAKSANKYRKVAAIMVVPAGLITMLYSFAMVGFSYHAANPPLSFLIGSVLFVASTSVTVIPAGAALTDQILLENLKKNGLQERFSDFSNMVERNQLPANALIQLIEFLENDNRNFIENAHSNSLIKNVRNIFLVGIPAGNFSAELLLRAQIIQYLTAILLSKVQSSCDQFDSLTTCVSPSQRTLTILQNDRGDFKEIHTAGQKVQLIKSDRSNRTAQFRIGTTNYQIFQNSDIDWSLSNQEKKVVLSCQKIYPNDKHGLIKD